MSVNRLIARLAAVCALNNYMQEPWPTLAGPAIFDSKIVPIEDMKLDRAFPCIVVYTDYDKDAFLKGGSPHKERQLTLTLELLIVQAEEIVDDGSPVWRLSSPQTDSEIEATLDFLEMQALRALTAGTEASDALNFICTTPIAVISRRGASVEGGQRLGARQITLEMKAIRDQIEGPIPPTIEAFLQKLEDFSDYQAIVPEIRAFYSDNAARQPGDRVRQTFAYPRAVADAIALPLGVQPVLVAPITYHLTGISP